MSIGCSVALTVCDTESVSNDCRHIAGDHALDVGVQCVVRVDPAGLLGSIDTNRNVPISLAESTTCAASGCFAFIERDGSPISRLSAAFNGHWDSCGWNRTSNPKPALGVASRCWRWSRSVCRRVVHIVETTRRCRHHRRPLQSALILLASPLLLATNNPRPSSSRD